MFNNFIILKSKKVLLFCLAFFYSIAVLTNGLFLASKAYTPEISPKMVQAANMISGLFDFIKQTNKATYSSDIVSDTVSEKIIKVYFHKEGYVKEMSLEEYITGVLYGEVPSYYCEEALKAQAVAARSYTLYKINNGITHENGADICTDYSHCQAWTPNEKESLYPDSIVQAVEATQNIICTYEGACINALYFSNSAGATESIENVWGGNPVPYLKSVYSPGEAEFYDYCQVKVYSQYEFAALINAYNSSIFADFESGIENIQNIQRSPSGRILSAEIGGITFTGLQIRAMFGLRSANVHFCKTGESISVVALGYGHGVGMSQCGAQAMAQSGATYDEILKHYYTGIELSSIA